ncbi:MAG: family 43 glycosylhydrolase [Clostridiales bacterium]|nr:family 43 glycosylhydrolase [Clostridiales bacterium]
MKKQVFNPYLPSYEYVPDGEPRIFNDRLYIFGSHDKFNGKEYCENDYVCWSAPLCDVSDWKYEGVIYKKEQHQGVIRDKIILYAPDVIQGKEGLFYLFYSVANSSVISVAVCDKPAGKYRYYGDIHDKKGRVVGLEKGSYFQFDPSVFIDDDGEIYLYSGFCGKKEIDAKGRFFVGAHVCTLEDDMLTVRTEPKIILSRNDCPDNAKFFEASSMRKIGDLYYFVYSARITGLHYCTSKYPDRDFIYRGRIHSSSDIGINGHTEENPAYPVGNTHGGIICINEQYYIFDHRFTNGTSFCRQGVAEPIFIEENGYIKQAEATSCGLNGRPLLGKGEYPFYIVCNLMDINNYKNSKEKEKNKTFLTQSGEDRESGEEQYVTNFHNNCIAGFKYFNFKDFKGISFKLRGRAKGKIFISNSEKGDFVGECAIDINCDEWTEVYSEFSIMNGIGALFFKYVGENFIEIISFKLF